MSEQKSKRKQKANIHFSSRMLFILCMINLAGVLCVGVWCIGSSKTEEAKNLINESRLDQFESEYWNLLDELQMIDEQLQDIQKAEAHASFAMFSDFGVVGDSFASGFLSTEDGAKDCYDISWCEILARKNGVRCYNFSGMGYSTRSWLNADDAPKGLAAFDETEPLDLYIISLGVNDRYQLGAEYIGTVQDMQQSLDRKPDTFYGNYSRIIEHIMGKAPNAKIIIMTTIDNTSEDAKAFNIAIANVAAYYGFPCINLYLNEYFKSDFYFSNLIDAHPTSANYSRMALVIENMIECAIVENADYFSDFSG